MVDLIDGVEGCLVVLGCQVDFHQVVVYFVGILGVREIIQEIFEDRNRFAESGKGRFMDQQRIIEHGYFLNLFVE